MTMLERAATLIAFIVIGGFYWAHTKGKKEAEWLFGGSLVAVFLLYLFAAATGTA